jgi:hypothetical protein
MALNGEQNSLGSTFNVNKGGQMEVSSTGARGRTWVPEPG